MSYDAKSYLSELLPYDPNEKIGERLKHGLKEYLFLLVALEQTIEALKAGKLTYFDPLVGENACQIRAVKIALTVPLLLLESDEILKSVNLAKIKAKETLDNISNSLVQNGSLKDCLIEQKIDITLREDLLFLLLSFILTKTKVVHPFFKIDKPLVENAYTDSRKIKEMGEIGSSFACDLVKKIRRKLAASSVSFVQNISTELDFSMHENSLLSNQFIMLHNGLACLPYYWATQALMSYSLRKKIPIALLAQQRAKDQDYKVIQNITIFFQAVSGEYQEVAYPLMDPEIPALVLIGTTCRDFKKLPIKKVWKQELLEQSPIDLVLAYAAAHRQYPDESGEQLVIAMQDESYKYHKVKAQEWGCSLENASRFFLTHAFCDKIKNIRI